MPDVSEIPEIYVSTRFRWGVIGLKKTTLYPEPVNCILILKYKSII